MNIDIKENVINNIKTEDEKSLVAIVDESVLSDDELVLPGLGVVLGLFWDQLSKDEKLKMAKFALNKIK